MITAITLTGDRPEAFALCRKWIEKQTVKPDQWIIVDDGKHPVERPTGTDYVYRKPTPGEPRFTMLLNLKMALSRIKGDKILIMEDDEYYHPKYIESMVERLGPYQIVGIGHSKYYYLPTGGYIAHDNMNHASFAQTAFDKTVVPMLEHLLDRKNMFIDIDLWSKFASEGYYRQGLCSVFGNVNKGLVFRDLYPCLYVGMKGLPGRSGIGIGHNARTYTKHDIPDRKLLKQWVAEDYHDYLNLIGKGKQ